MIKLRTLNLEPLNYQLIEHCKLVRELNEDKNVQSYVSKRFESWIEKPETEDKYEVGKSYVIYDNDRLIGMCGSTEFNPNGIMDIWIAIEKSERGEGYGEKGIVQLTSYLIETFDNLNDIKLLVNRSNHASNRMVINSGYTLTDKYDDKNEYRYFGK